MRIGSEPHENVAAEICAWIDDLCMAEKSRIALYEERSNDIIKHVQMVHDDICAPQAELDRIENERTQNNEKRTDGIQETRSF